MKFLSFFIISLALIACDGTETASNPSTSTELDFTSSELSRKILFSEEVLQSNIQDGFILKFDETTLQETGSISSNDNTGLFGEYDWEIVNDKLQVTYPSSVTCTTTKTEEESLEYNSESSCSGGTPENNIITGRLIKPLSFNKSSLTNSTITIELGADKEEILEFNSDGSTFLFTARNNGVDSSPENGTFNSAIYTNTVRLNYTNDGEYSLLVLLDGSLTNGLLLDLRYESDTDDLNRVRIYSINSNDVWQLEETFDSIRTDS